MKKLFAAISMVFAFGTAASAQTQTFSLNAELTYSDLATAAVFGSTELTGTLTGQFSFDLSAPVVGTGGNAIAETASYEFISLTFNIGNQVLNFTSDAAVGRVLEVSNAFGGGTDQVQLSGPETVSLAGTDRTTALFVFDISGFGLFDSTSLTSVALAADPAPEVNIFGSSGGVLVLDGFEQFVEFEEATIRAVPEPATWLMMIIGFAGVGFAAKRRRRALNA